MSRGLHLLGADAKSKDEKSKTDYTPLVEAAGSVAKEITSALTDWRSAQVEAERARGQAQVEQAKAEASSNTMWYVGGAAVVAAILAFLTLRGR